MDVGGRELGDPVLAETEGGARIEEAAAGKLRGRGVLPQGFVGGEGIDRITEDAPAGVVAVGLYDVRGGGSGQRLGENGGVAQLEIEFSQNELAEGDVWSTTICFRP